MASDTPGNGFGPEAGATIPPPLDAEPPRPGIGARTAGPTLFRERFEQLLPTIQKEWPQVAQHTLEATRGSLDMVVEVIARQTGRTSEGVKAQLLDLLHATGDQAHQLADSLRPLEDQLEHLLDELNSTLRPRIEKPVRERPLLALGVAAGVGLLTGLLLASGRRSA
ncbi:MAG: glycine zipper domain-containing protein [Vulcanococcus sp.]